MKKAADYVCEGHNAINSAINSIDCAIQSTEKSANKAILERAKSALNSTCSDLNSFTD